MTPHILALKSLSKAVCSQKLDAKLPPIFSSPGSNILGVGVLLEGFFSSPQLCSLRPSSCSALGQSHCSVSDMVQLKEKKSAQYSEPLKCFDLPCPCLLFLFQQAEIQHFLEASPSLESLMYSLLLSPLHSLQTYIRKKRAKREPERHSGGK